MYTSEYEAKRNLGALKDITGGKLDYFKGTVYLSVKGYIAIVLNDCNYIKSVNFNTGKHVTNEYKQNILYKVNKAGFKNFKITNGINGEWTLPENQQGG